MKNLITNTAVFITSFSFIAFIVGYFFLGSRVLTSLAGFGIIAGVSLVVGYAGIIAIIDIYKFLKS